MKFILMKLLIKVGLSIINNSKTYLCLDHLMIPQEYCRQLLLNPIKYLFNSNNNNISMINIVFAANPK